METPGESSDTQRELRELRVRAYGPAADIDRDPVALARLVDLESRQRQAHISTELLRQPRVASPAGPSPSPADAVDHATVTVCGAPSSVASANADARGSHCQQRLTPLGGRLRLAVAAGMTTIALVYGADWLMSPRPAATLLPTAPAGVGGPGGPDRWIVVSGNDDLFAEVIIDHRTLTPYGTFRGVEVWAAVDSLDSPCLILIEESSQDTLQGVCTPRSGDLVADVGAWPRLGDDFAQEFTAGTVFRFRQHGTTIDAFVIEASDTR